MYGDREESTGVFKTVQAHSKENLTAIAGHSHAPLLATGTASQVSINTQPLPIPFILFPQLVWALFLSGRHFIDGSYMQESYLRLYQQSDEEAYRMTQCYLEMLHSIHPN